MSNRTMLGVLCGVTCFAMAALFAYGVLAGSQTAVIFVVVLGLMTGFLFDRWRKAPEGS